MVSVMRVLALLLIATAPLGAQGALRGTLFDSLRTLRPVAGALVTLGDGRYVALTDRDGEFVFADIPAGEVTVRWSAPWLDSLGIPAVVGVARVRSRSEARVRLATPSARTIGTSRCDGLAVTDGILMGRISGLDGAPRPGASLRVTWTQSGTSAPDDPRADDVAITRSRDDGTFLLCGVPRSADLRVSASHGRDSSGVVTLRLSGRVVDRQDLVISDGSVIADLTGRVTGPRGESVGGATVTVVGEPSRRAHSSPTGEFRLPDIPLRTTQIIVRAGGLVPDLATGMPALDGRAFRSLGDLLAFPADSVREMVVMSGAPVSVEERGFEERRLMYRGAFFDAVQLSRLRLVDATSLFSNEVALVRGSPLIRLAYSNCRPLLFVNGYPISRQLDGWRERELVMQARRIEIYEARFMPAEFHDALLCGSVVVWHY